MALAGFAHAVAVLIEAAGSALLVGFVLALFGTYWDDAWVTGQGWDLAPHLARLSALLDV